MINKVKPKRFVNYNKYTMFISFLAHEFKRLGTDNFIKEYKNKKYSGINQKYLDSYIDYLENKKYGNHITCNNISKILVVEPCIYTTYFKFGDKNAINEALTKAIPEFLNRGLLVTEIQEAVHTSSNTPIPKK